jgi:hypothetical protein
MTITPITRREQASYRATERLGSLSATDDLIMKAQGKGRTSATLRPSARLSDHFGGREKGRRCRPPCSALGVFGWGPELAAASNKNERFLWASGKRRPVAWDGGAYEGRKARESYSAAST